MDTVMVKIFSRKLAVAMAGILATFFSGLPEPALAQLLEFLMVYIASQGAVDIAKAIKGD